MFDHFSWVASFYDRLLGSPNSTYLKKLLKLPTSGYLLDAGGGTGRVSHSLKSLSDQVVITDPSRPMLYQAQAKNNLLTVQAFTERLPFPDHFFHRIVVVDSLHHFADQSLALQELLRVLHHHGRMVIEEPDINLTSIKIVALLEKMMGMKSRFYKPQEIRRMVIQQNYRAWIEHDDRYSAFIIVER